MDFPRLLAMLAYILEIYLLRHSIQYANRLLKNLRDKGYDSAHQRAVAVAQDEAVVVR